jgi:soluble lytic murein transglycosylase-like protein
VNGPAPTGRLPGAPDRRWLLVVAAAAVALTAAVAFAVRDTEPRFASDVFETVGDDPFAFAEERTSELEERAAAGFSHVLYEKSAGGAIATARRTKRYRGPVEAAARSAGIDPELIEAIVFLESGGRPDVIAGSDPENAAGLTQILAETGQNLLGMRIDLRASRRLTRRIARAERKGQTARAARLRARRRRVDERFQPRKALQATGRYLKLARERFGSEELAAVSYHMGIGNLEGALRAYAGANRDDAIDEVVESERLSYARLYFDSSPERNAEAYARLARLGDDSATYYWRLLASSEVMRLSRDDPGRLARLAELHTAKPSSEEVLHPRQETEVFEDPEELEDAYRAGKLLPLPDDPERFNMVTDARVGERAGDLGREPALYRGLRPAALALAGYLGERVSELGGVDAPLTMASAVRDREYQRLLTGEEAAGAYSLHTTGYAFDVLRRYRSREQALAFEFMLGRLQALNLIAWSREPAVIQITVSEEAGNLLLARP